MKVNIHTKCGKTFEVDGLIYPSIINTEEILNVFFAERVFLGTPSVIIIGDDGSPICCNHSLAKAIRSVLYDDLSENCDLEATLFLSKIKSLTGWTKSEDVEELEL